MNEAQDTAAVLDAIKTVDELNQRKFEALKLLGSVASVADSPKVLDDNRATAYMVLGRMEAISELKALIAQENAASGQIIDTTAT